MISVRVDVRAAVRKLESIIAGLDKAVDRGVQTMAEAGRKTAQGRAKGRVRRGIEVQRDGRATKLVSTAPWSSIVEQGRGPIRAKGDGLLRFVVSGRVIFTKRVGPARPRPFMKPAGVVMARSNAVEREVTRLVNGA